MPQRGVSKGHTPASLVQAELVPRLLGGSPSAVPTPCCFFLNGPHGRILQQVLQDISDIIHPNFQVGCRNQSPERTSNFPKITQQVELPLPTGLGSWSSHCQAVPALLPSRVGLALHSESTGITGASYVGQLSPELVIGVRDLHKEGSMHKLGREVGYVPLLSLTAVRGRLSLSQPRLPVACPGKLGSVRGHLASVDA